MNSQERKADRVKIGVLIIFTLSLLSCRDEKEKQDVPPLNNLHKVEYGKSKFTFSEIVGIGGYQDIKEQEIERKESSLSDLMVEREDSEDHTRIKMKAGNIAFDYNDDVLPFIELSFLCGKGERFFGFGEWADYADATGLKREIWTQEQHFGGDWNKEPLPLGKMLTYFPVPFFISSHNYAFFVSGYSRMEFSMCEDGKLWKVKVFSDEIEFFIFPWRRKPLEATEKFTALVGRQKVPPIWAFGNWLDEIMGQDNVLKTARWAREKKIPFSAIWTEDWVGGVWRVPGKIYNIKGWDIQEGKELYPDIKGLSAELRKLGIRFLGYFHTFVVKENKVYALAEEEGVILKDRKGRIREYLHPAEGKVVLLDLLNPKTRDFMFDVMRFKVSLGFSGWMADFGEWVTPDVVSYDGRSGWEFHNLYPYLWAKMNREFFENEGIDDFVFFSRSGYTGSWAFSPVVWQGDQDTSFERFDGLPSVIPSMTSLGIVGVANVGPDIAGYTSFPAPSDKELYLRWTALCAFVPVFRTHHGTSPLENWRFYRDEETAERFKYYAEWHMRVVPYILELSRTGQEKGWPAVRHIFLEYPDIAKLMDVGREVIEQQFLLGDRVLVIPIVERGVVRREAFIPPGKWVGLMNKVEYDGGEGGKFVTVEIKVGDILVLVKQGTCLKFFEPIPHSLVEIDDTIKEKLGLLDIRDVKVVERCF